MNLGLIIYYAESVLKLVGLSLAVALMLTLMVPG